jgi:hypothetical protein
MDLLIAMSLFFIAQTVLRLVDIGLAAGRPERSRYILVV